MPWWYRRGFGTVIAPPNAQGSVSLRSGRRSRCVATATSGRSMRSRGCARCPLFALPFPFPFVFLVARLPRRTAPRHTVAVSSDKIARRGNGTPSWRPERDAPVWSRGLVILINSDRDIVFPLREGRRVRSSRQDVERNDAFRSSCECLNLSWISSLRHSSGSTGIDETVPVDEYVRKYPAPFWQPRLLFLSSRFRHRRRVHAHFFFSRHHWQPPSHNIPANLKILDNWVSFDLAADRAKGFKRTRVPVYVYVCACNFVFTASAKAPRGTWPRSDVWLIEENQTGIYIYINISSVIIVPDATNFSIYWFFFLTKSEESKCCYLPKHWRVFNLI